MIAEQEAQDAAEIAIGSPASYIDRELSWLAFARRVLAQVEDPELPLLERVKFAGIVGMLHDEFFWKRMSRLKRRIRKGSAKTSLDGRRAPEHLLACRQEILAQMANLESAVEGQLRPALAREGLAILNRDSWNADQRRALRSYFEDTVLPILTPLAVDAEHPFPFISNDALNLAVVVPVDGGGERFVRIKVPDNRPRWAPLPDGFAPLEDVIAANLDLLFAASTPLAVYRFRVTRAAEGARGRASELEVHEVQREPGSLVLRVRRALKARRFAGVVRLQVESGMPAEMVEWIAEQLTTPREDIYTTRTFLGISDLLHFDVDGRPDLRAPSHQPVTHPRLSGCPAGDPAAIFHEIARGDFLLHHPYHSFDSSVLRFLESAAVDPQVLAIKLTIYRTARDSPIVQALAEAARRGKQVAVLVEITARFDEAPNIAWGDYLEKEGVHVAYGVKKLKTHVKLALVVREEDGRLRRYAHAGTGNYHTGTARIYEDLGILTARGEICDEVAAVFNQLTGATAAEYEQMLVAPTTMRPRFIELIRREAAHTAAGREAGIRAKMNQLQDPAIIRELYRASRAGVPIELNVRGLCCLKPGVPGLSETIRVFGIVSRFLEHSRIYRFANGGEPEHYIGSADWMHRNLSKRVETIAPVLDASVATELDRILDIYADDNASAWDCGADGMYVRRSPAPGEERRAAQEALIRWAEGSG